MSNKNGVAIEVTYQAAGAATGLGDVKMDVYDELHAEDVGKAVAAMTEIGTTGRYFASFTPDAEGEWQVHIDSITTPGKVVKHYSVVGHDVDSVGDDVATVDGKVVTVDGKVDTAIAGVATVDGKVDALVDITPTQVATELETYDAVKKSELDAIQGGSETLESIKTAVDSVSSVNPPMVG